MVEAVDGCSTTVRAFSVSRQRRQSNLKPTCIAVHGVVGLDVVGLDVVGLEVVGLEVVAWMLSA